MKFSLLLLIGSLCVACVLASGSGATTGATTGTKLNGIQAKSSAIISSADQQRKMRQESDKKEIGAYLNGKNLLRAVIKLLFGNNEESAATSRQVLSVLVKVLDLLRNSFTQKARNSNSALRNAVDDASVAALTMMKGVVKSVLSPDVNCAQRFMCEASSQAAREGRELAYLVAQVGGYASSYLLENQKGPQYNKSYEASRRGRSGEDCAKLYAQCGHLDL